MSYYVKSNNDIFYIIFSVCLLLARYRSAYLFISFVYLLAEPTKFPLVKKSTKKKNKGRKILIKSPKRPNEIDFEFNGISVDYEAFSCVSILQTSANFIVKYVRENYFKKPYKIDNLEIFNLPQGSASKSKKSSARTRCKIAKLW